MIAALCAAPCMGARGYVSALPTLISERNKIAIFRVYVTDALRIIGSLDRRYADIIDEKPKETRTAEEIAADVIARAGLIHAGEVS